MCRLGLGHCGLMSGIVSRLLDTNMISGHQYCPGTSECYGHKGTSSCCSEHFPCEEGLGDCYSDDECAPGRVRGHDNCEEFNSYAQPTYDCCVRKQVEY